ncbi:MAG: twin-arginine translocation signal domain-containing protein [Planctomycetota bacterium]
MQRREFLKQAGAVGAAMATAHCPLPMAAAEPDADPMPMITLGTLRVSRVFLGSNPFFGFCHGNPQATGDEMRDWYTPQRVMSVLDEAADLGINAVWTPCYDHWVRLWNDYRDKGGRLQNWIAQPDRRPMEAEIRTAVKHGATAVCIQGCNVDDEVRHGRWEVVRGWLELVKSHDLPAGIATHGATTHLEAEEKGLPTDFYHQTMYRPDDYVPAGREESLAMIARLAKPVVAYKILGAGRIKPADALPYAFQRMKRKDGICVGVFPNKNPREIAENVALTRQCTKQFAG